MWPGIAVAPGAELATAGRPIETLLIASGLTSELLHKVPRSRVKVPASWIASRRRRTAAARLSDFGMGAAPDVARHLPYRSCGVMLRSTLQPRIGVVQESSIVTGRCFAGNLTTHWSGRDHE
jgi:hypothetical protein